MSLNTIEFEVRDGVGHLALNRPEAANAINPEMAAELETVALRCEADRAIRCILLSGPGRIFCGGGDLAAFASFGAGLADELDRMVDNLHNAIAIFSRQDAPLVAAVGGTAAGAGFSLVTMANLAIASQNARFTMAYTNAGLAPDGSSTFFLPRLIGVRRAEELMLTNRVLSAEEALDWGLVNQVVPEGQLTDTAEALALQLAQGPTLAYAHVHRLLMKSYGNDLLTQLDLETHAIVSSGRTHDGREGIAAFVEKRKPEFEGG